MTDRLGHGTERPVFARCTWIFRSAGHATVRIKLSELGFEPPSRRPLRLLVSAAFGTSPELALTETAVVHVPVGNANQ